MNIKVKHCGKDLFTKVFFDFREIGVLVPLIVFMLLFTVQNSNFISMENIVNILRNTSFALISGVGMTFLLITGAFDLSVGALIAFSGVMTGLLMQAGVPIWLAISIGLIGSMLVGALNGFFCVKLNIPPFIAGIGMQYILKGIVLVVQAGAPVYPLPSAFNAIGAFEIIGIPLVVILAAVIAIIGHIVLKYTVFGRKLFAVGGNCETARLAGIRCDRIQYAAWIIVAVLTGISGILTAARLASAQPTAGASFELTVIAGCIIGGTSLFGGAGSILGTVLGAIFMNMMTNGMTIIKLSPYWQQLVLGIIIITSVAFDQFRVSRKV
ncbi:MAG: ABC transporter permease [Clostridia bacterium]